jgi:hypothetical protein
MLQLTRTPLALRLEADDRTRLLILEPLIDSAPVVTLDLPARDTVLREARGSIAVNATVRDEFGLRSAAIEYIVSSGESETFTFRSGTLGTRQFRGERSAVLRARLDLQALELRAGDVVHVRVSASDLRPPPDTAAGRGVSETRAIRIARPGEYDSVAVEAALPAEADKSLLSQRMLINLTEALIRKQRSMAAPEYSSESRGLARDQARLRRQVGDIVFSRLGDDPSGEHFHGDGHDHEAQVLRPAMTPEELMKAAENAAAPRAGDVLDLHNDTPILSINRPLLEAYNAMWDAGRELELGLPQAALPHMYRALEAIQRARAAERLYLRSRPTRAVVDIDRVRLSGSERGSPAPRRSGPAAEAGRRALERFRTALSILLSAPSAAADSLLLLRLELLDSKPQASAALRDAADALRSGRDATEALRRARSALERAGGVADSLPRWSWPP